MFTFENRFLFSGCLISLWLLKTVVSFRPSAGHSKGIEDMDMNAVRLCFQCEFEWEDGRKDCLSPVVSNPIYDKSKKQASIFKPHQM